MTARRYSSSVPRRGGNLTPLLASVTTEGDAGLGRFAGQHRPDDGRAVPHIKDLDWSMVNSSSGAAPWPLRLFPMDKHYRWLGRSGAAGQGYGPPASIGAALGNKSLGRFSFSYQGDGDLMYVPGSLWTATHHNIPMLMMVHNNRGYHQEVMHVQRLSNRRNRVANLGKTMGPGGTSIENPESIRRPWRSRWAGGPPVRSRIRPNSAPCWRRRCRSCAPASRR